MLVLPVDMECLRHGFRETGHALERSEDGGLGACPHIEKGRGLKG